MKNLTFLFLLSTALTFGQNILLNPTFADGKAPWQNGQFGAGMGTTTFQTADSQDAGNGSVLVEVATAGTAANQIWLRQNSITIEPSTEYTISFWIKSNNATDDVRVQVYSQGSDTGGDPTDTFFNPGTPGFQTPSFVGDGTYKEVIITFSTAATFPAEINSDGFGLQFGFGTRTGTYTIDNILLAKSSTLGTNEFTTESKVTAYPNPATDVLNLSGEITASSYSIYDMLGRAVKSNITATRRINVSDLNQGIYYLISDKNRALKFSIVNR